MNVKRDHLTVKTLIGWRSRPTVVKGSGIRSGREILWCSHTWNHLAGAENITLDVTIRENNFVQFKFMLSYQWLDLVPCSKLGCGIHDCIWFLETNGPREAWAAPKTRGTTGKTCNGRKQQPRQISVTDLSRRSARTLQDTFSFRNKNSFSFWNFKNSRSPLMRLPKMFT